MKVEVLTNEIEQIRFNMSKLKRTDENFELLNEIAQQQLTETEQEKLRYLHTDEQIEQMMDEVITLELVGRFKEDLHVYSDAEKRSLLLLAIQSIVYDFQRGDVQVEYRLTPYVELEDAMKSITQKKKVTV